MTAFRRWPGNLIGRYPTIGGATVDLHPRTNKTGARTQCTGCPFTTSPWDEDEARDRARAHAETCRATPRPDGAQ